MQEKFDTINFDYVETRKVSVFGKMVAIVITAILVITPLYEFIPQLEPVIESCTYGIVGTCGCIVGW